MGNTKNQKKISAKSGLRVKSLPQGGFLFMSGLRPRDRIITVNGYDIADELDFYYHCAMDCLEIGIERGGRVGTVEAERPPGSPLEAGFYEKPVNRCANRCVFCFIDQMPKGLRRSLYIKDEDFKHSFLNGNYVTLASAQPEDLRRIVSIGLSPLFVSVHATDREVRAAMLGNRRIPDVREQLAYLSENGVSFHTQIVLCPGYNDGKVLERTIKDLFGYGKSLLSIAVVPVGLTKFRKIPLAAVDRQLAINTCNKLGAISDRMKRKEGIRKLFVADEFFIRAELPIPPASYYEDYPQIENGVGLVRRLLQDGAKLKRQLTKKIPVDKKLKKNFPVDKNVKSNSLVITGCSAYPFVKKILVNRNYDIIPVENYYFGESVTVAGLLTAKDVIRKIKNISAGKKYHEVILPGVMFNHEGYTLDGYSAARIGKSINMPVRVIQSMEKIYA